MTSIDLQRVLDAIKRGPVSTKTLRTRRDRL